MKSEIHTIRDMQLKMKKTPLIRGKITKTAVTFRKNKPNFKNIKIGVSSFQTSKYEILPAWRSKKQTQFKANSNPIAKMPKMSANIYHIREYNNETFFPAPKTKPNKAKVANLSPRDNQSSIYPQGVIDNQLRSQNQLERSASPVCPEPAEGSRASCSEFYRRNGRIIKIILECRSRGSNLQKYLKDKILLSLALSLKSWNLLSSSQKFAARMPLRKLRSLRIKKLTTSRTDANFHFRRVISRFGCFKIWGSRNLFFGR